MRRQRFQPNGVIHVGAHEGQEAEAYARAKAGPVLWCEGNGALIPELKANVRRWDAWGEQRVVHTLVGATTEDGVLLNVANNGQSSSVLPLGTHALVHPEIHYTDATKAPMTTVDALVEKHGIEADFFNIDTQGYDLEVLKGAELFLAEQVQVIYIEVNDDPLYEGGALRPEIEDWLLARGFRMRELCMMRQGWGDAVFMRGTEGVR